MKSVAILLPNVMVPVFIQQQNIYITSSFDRSSLVAITFFCNNLSIPLIPIALKSPPIVVGIRHTRREISTGRVRFIFCGNPDDLRLYEKKQEV